MPSKKLVPKKDTTKRRDTEVQMPETSWGECRVARCVTITMLANGYCVTHWDRGIGGGV
jgi:hypothetical protein